MTRTYSNQAWAIAAAAVEYMNMANNERQPYVFPVGDLKATGGNPKVQFGMSPLLSSDPEATVDLPDLVQFIIDRLDADRPTAETPSVETPFGASLVGLARSLQPLLDAVQLLIAGDAATPPGSAAALSRTNTIHIEHADGVETAVYVRVDNDLGDLSLDFGHLVDIRNAAGHCVATLMGGADDASKDGPTAFDQRVANFSTAIGLAFGPPPAAPSEALGVGLQNAERPSPAMRLRDIIRVNVERCHRWHPGGPDEWSPAQWLLATMGELGELAAEILSPSIGREYYLVRAVADLGEAANTAKKLWRIENGMANKSADAARQINDADQALSGMYSELCDLLYSVNGIFYAFDLPGLPTPMNVYRGTTRPVDPTKVAKEWADTFIYLGLLAARLRIDPDKAIIETFNQTSLRYSFPERLPAAPGWKIVGVDNHARETVADKLWTEHLTDRDDAERIAAKLNDGLGDGPGTFYRVIPMAYELQRGMEDLI